MTYRSSAVRWMQSEEAPRPSPTEKQKLRVQWKHAVPNTLRKSLVLTDDLFLGTQRQQGQH